jgi:hypothetical protein
VSPACAVVLQRCRASRGVLSTHMVHKAPRNDEHPRARSGGRERSLTLPSPPFRDHPRRAETASRLRGRHITRCRGNHEPLRPRHETTEPFTTLLAVPSAPPSNTQVGRAGDVLRRAAQSGATDLDSLEGARRVVEAFRRKFLHPHLDLRDRLDQLVQREIGAGAAVTARWKRYDRIVDKLGRLETLRLSQMHDVGGCRIVLAASSNCAASMILRRRPLRSSAWSSATPAPRGGTS